jgi:sortase A
METAERPVAVPRASTRSRWLRRGGTTLIVAGVAFFAWAFVTWQWNDPFTSLYTRWEQRKLESEYAELVAKAPPPPPAVAPAPTKPGQVKGAQAPVSAPAAPDPAAIAAAAATFRKEATTGAAIGRIVVPQLGVNMVFVNGTDTDTLKKGPGLHPTTFMPGEGELVYIAGHRTTYGAPFAKIDRMKPGDRFTLEMPYGTFTYQVTGHTIVDDQDLSVLESNGRERVALQACHPRFFATERYIVWAKPVGVTRPGT